MIDPRDVTAILVTRGDCDLGPILDSLVFRAVLVWDNARQPDCGAYGRYIACETAFTEAVFVQDDDCIVSPEAQLTLCEMYEPGVLVSNMCEWHNANMPLLALPGWGAIFERNLAQVALDRWRDTHEADFYSDDFRRIGCDIVFPVLTPSWMVDLGHENLPYAWATNRTHLRPDYQGKKHWYYREAARLRERAAA